MSDTIFLQDVATTSKRRHNLFCWSTKASNQNEVIAWLMLRSFRESGERRQAELIEEWYINKSIPKELEANWFVDELNLGKGSTLLGSLPSASSLPQTSNSSSSRRGMKTGIFTSLRRKSASINADFSMYDELERVVAQNIAGHPATDYRTKALCDLDKWTQPNPMFARQTHYLKLILAAHTFDPDRMGIY